MRFDKTVTEAHRWVRNGDHPNDESTYLPIPNDGTVAMERLTEGKVVGHWTEGDPASLHDRCSSPLANHGNLGGEMVCPGDWIVTTKSGYEHVADDPFANQLIIHENGVEQTVVAYLGSEEQRDIKVIFYADCREHARRKFTDRIERDDWAAAHRLDTRHVVDVYEVEQ
jgi:hypothetical protein